MQATSGCSSDDVVTVYSARSFVTMDESRGEVGAVAVRDGRIVATGGLDEVLASCREVSHVHDETFAGRTVVPGLIDQHVHPLLGATALTTAVIAPEAWELPSRTIPAATTQEAYDERLREAQSSLPVGEWLFSWGFHELWHGRLDRHRLDALTGGRPTAVWQRSVHEWYLNTAAIETLGLAAGDFAGQGPASDMCDFERGHFWEGGWMVLLAPHLAPVFFTEERFRVGLAQFVEYLHANGVTAINEPGIAWEAEPWDLYEEILGHADTPFSTTFLVDGRTQSLKIIDPGAMVADARAQVARAGEGKVSLVDGQVKLFADGAIISQLMQLQGGYLDVNGNPDPSHHGEWMMEPEALARSFDAYWDADWQVHIHVNGDLGLDVVLDVLERAMNRRPRLDHRTVIVHFAVSSEEQVARIARLGAIVSANPYYPVGFADKYSVYGLGPTRADAMVRARSVLDHGIPLSFHSDLPMGPSDPLAMVGFAVNRRTPAGRVAGPDQRISVLEALRAVTIGAAYSWRREHDLGSITPGKIANFTVLAEHPFEVDPEDLASVAVVGTMFEGRWFPVSPSGTRATSASAPMVRPSRRDEQLRTSSCGCDVALLVAGIAARLPRAS